YEACNLGSINVAKMVKRKGSRVRGQGSGKSHPEPFYDPIPDPRPPIPVFEIDWDKLEYVTKEAVHFLDNVIDMNKYPLPEIENMAKGNRKIGLGVMGFADMMVRLRIPYNSEDALKVGEGLMRFINEKAWETSRELAKERRPFPNIKGSIFDTGVRGQVVKGTGVPFTVKVRNATTTTIAPTGTLSIIAGCSSGIEPIFSLSYTRQVLDGLELPELNPLLPEVARAEGFYSDGLMDFVAKGGELTERDDIPDKIKKVFITAYHIPPEGHIKMQAVFQKYTDNAVSKTINLPQKATPEDVKKAYLLAYKLGCKGITIYRSGTREEQVLSCKNTLYC
ncbi:MAG: hypothetical protein HY878_07105, partial [Deltaproteobacteria bacterium]|nr:hypothetical protein [Deltaproteobacteria bacterium]